MMIVNKSLKAKNLAIGKRKIVGIVLHDTAGSGKHGDTEYLAKPGDGRKVSVDFTVERNGDVYQLNPDLTGAWTYHAGRATSFKGLKNAAVTRGTIGIELVQKADLSLVPMWPDAQVKAVAELCSYLCKEYKLDKTAVTTHALIITDGSRSDPRKFPFDKFWQFFNEASNGPGTQQAQQRQAVYHDVVAGDTLYRLAKKYATTIEEIKRLNGMNGPSNLLKAGARLLVNP